MHRSIAELAALEKAMEIATRQRGRALALAQLIETAAQRGTAAAGHRRRALGRHRRAGAIRRDRRRRRELPDPVHHDDAPRRRSDQRQLARTRARLPGHDRRSRTARRRRGAGTRSAFSGAAAGNRSARASSAPKAIRCFSISCCVRRRAGHDCCRDRCDARRWRAPIACPLAITRLCRPRPCSDIASRSTALRHVIDDDDYDPTRADRNGAGTVQTASTWSSLTRCSATRSTNRH